MKCLVFSEKDSC